MKASTKTLLVTGGIAIAAALGVRYLDNRGKIPAQLS